MMLQISRAISSIFIEQEGVLMIKNKQIREMTNRLSNWEKC